MRFLRVCLPCGAGWRWCRASQEISVFRPRVLLLHSVLPGPAPVKRAWVGWSPWEDARGKVRVGPIHSGGPVYSPLRFIVPPGHRPRPACERQFESAGDGNIPNASGGVSGWPLGVGDMQGRRDRKSGLHPPVRFRVGDQLEPSSMSIMKHFGPRRERLSSTRLETRTKESSDCASTRVFKTQFTKVRNESESAPRQCRLCRARSVARP